MSPEDKKLVDEIIEKATDRVRQETRKLEQWILDNKYRIVRLGELREVLRKHKLGNAVHVGLNLTPMWHCAGEIGFHLMGAAEVGNSRRYQPLFSYVSSPKIGDTADIEQFVGDNFNLYAGTNGMSANVVDRVIEWAERELSYTEMALSELAKKLGIESPVLPSKREELGATGNGGEAKLFYGDVAPTSGGSCMLTASTFPMSTGGSVTISAGSNKSL